MSYGSDFIDGGTKQITEYETKTTPAIFFNVSGGADGKPTLSNIKFVSSDGAVAPQSQKAFDELVFGVPMASGASIVSGSFRFTFNNEAYVEANGRLYKNIDPANGSGVEVGGLNIGRMEQGGG